MRLWAIAIAMMLCATRPAAAQSAAEAEALFREGKKLIKAAFAEGCAKLEASERLESSTGTLLNLGDCRESNGQLASAWAAFAKAASSAKRTNDPKREAEARRRANKLEPRLAHLAINVAHRVDGLQIDREDQTVDPEAWNTGVPTDAGAYEIQCAASAGFKSDRPRDRHQRCAVGGRRPCARRGTRAREGRSASASVVVAHDEPRESPSGTFTTKRKLAIAIGGAGVVGVSLGVVFGLKARDLQHQSDAICPQAACGDAHAVQLDHDGQSDARIANVAYAVGGAAIVGAVVLWFVGAPAATRESITLAPSTNGFAIAGSF